MSMSQLCNYVCELFQINIGTLCEGILWFISHYPDANKLYYHIHQSMPHKPSSRHSVLT
jgi:hypothetical protein